MTANHRYDSEMPFEWHFAGGPMLARFWWYLDRFSPHQHRKKNVVNVGPSLAKLSESAQDAQTRLSIHCEQIYDVRTLSIF